MYSYLFNFNIGTFEVHASDEDSARDKLLDHLEETIGTNEHYGYNLVNLVSEFIELVETSEPQDDGRLTLEERNK